MVIMTCVFVIETGKEGTAHYVSHLHSINYTSLRVIRSISNESIFLDTIVFISNIDSDLLFITPTSWDNLSLHRMKFKALALSVPRMLIFPKAIWILLIRLVIVLRSLLMVPPYTHSVQQRDIPA